MFEHLPIITEDSVKVMVENELPFFLELLKGSMKGTDSPDEAMERIASLYGVKDSNPFLVKAVKATAYGVAGELEGEVEPGLEWRAGMAAVPGVMAALRLIDRALEARELEQSLGT